MLDLFGVNVFSLTSGIEAVLVLAQLGLKVFALADSLRRSQAAYPAADKQTKKFWLIILGLALLANLLSGNALGFLNILGTIAALVYVVDARPAVAALGGGRGGRGGRRDGPYGPW